MQSRAYNVLPRELSRMMAAEAPRPALGASAAVVRAEPHAAARYRLRPGMNLSRLGRGEFLAVLGGLLLALGLFLPWYATNPDNRNANDRRRCGARVAPGRRSRSCAGCCSPRRPRR